MKKLHAMAIALAAASALPAWASSGSQASIGPIAVTVYDLNLTDGITSSVTFSPNNKAEDTAVVANTFQPKLNLQDRYVSLGDHPWDTLSESAHTPLAWATASLTGAASTTPIGAQLSIAGGAQTPAPSSNYLFDYALYESFSTVYDTSFTLSANSKVTFSALVSIAGYADNRANIFRDGDSAFALATLDLTGIGINGTGIQRGYSGLSETTYGSYAGNRTSFSFERLVNVSFENQTDHDLAGSITVLSWIQGRSYAIAAAPVPEPETYALFLSGLGLVGWAARRRKKSL